MPMMRRGPLDRYPVEVVLRQASAHRATGSLEFHAARPATLFLDEGRVYGAQSGLASERGGDPEPATEAAARSRGVEVLAGLLAEPQEGWYYLDPLGHLGGAGAWRWEVAGLLLDARTSNDEARTARASGPAPEHGPAAADSPDAPDVSPRALAPTPGRPVTVALNEPTTPPGRLSADAWTVIVATSGRRAATELCDELGWGLERLAEALGALERGGLLAPQEVEPAARRGMRRRRPA